MAETKTRAVEVAVVIMLAVAAISVSVGIFEAQEHRNASGWFTASAAALIIAVLIPVIVFGVFPLIEHIGKKDATMSTAAAQQAAAQSAVVSATQAIPDSWIKPDHLAEYLESINRTMREHGFGHDPNLAVVTVTPAELSKYFDDHIEMQAQKLVEPFIGKLMTVSGRVGDVSPWDEDVDRSTVNIDVGANGRPTVFAHFTDKKWLEHLSVLKRGVVVVVTGRIKSVGLAFVFLDDCELSG